MRIYARKFEADYEELERYNNMDTEPDITLKQLQDMISRLQCEDAYEPVPEKMEALQGYLKLVIAFSNIYRVDIAIETTLTGITVKICFNDSVLPEQMTRTLGRIITTSDGMCIWTKVREQEYDCVISLDFNIRKLRRTQ